uniref:D-alanyl-D-alanine carboxypeptidase n=1 Tax=Paracoccus sp. TaxID=267 RepID=UPI00289A42F4
MMIMVSRRAILGALLMTGAVPGALLANPRPKARPAEVATALPRAPSPADAPAPAPLGVDELIARANLDAAISFAVLDAGSGALLHSRDADLPIAPASTLKSITALYALSKLGSDHRFSTRVIRAGDMLVLAGGGDPELDSDGLAKLAKAAAEAEKAAGRPLPKRFAVWGGALPKVAEIAPGQAVHLPYNPTISGMILNFNRVHLGWRRGEKGYDLALEARGGRQSPRAYTVSVAVADRARPLFSYEAGADSGVGAEKWVIARQSMGKSGSRWLPVRRPE